MVHTLKRTQTIGVGHAQCEADRLGVPISRVRSRTVCCGSRPCISSGNSPILAESIAGELVLILRLAHKERYGQLASLGMQFPGTQVPSGNLSQHF